MTIWIVRRSALLALLMTAAVSCDRPAGLDSYFESSEPGQSCVSGWMWQGGDEESEQMKPGGNCIGCHAAEDEGPNFAIAGTVMGAVDDQDDCAGVDGITVEIMGAGTGESLTLTTNAAGNFFSKTGISVPYTARIIDAEGNERVMAGPQTDLNCANCHTTSGANGAPGRIFAP